MNTSASSISRTASQFLALLKFLVNCISIRAGLVPMSLAVRIIRGRLVNAAIHSFRKLDRFGGNWYYMLLTSGISLSDARAPM